MKRTGFSAVLDRPHYWLADGRVQACLIGGSRRACLISKAWCDSTSRSATAASLVWRQAADLIVVPHSIDEVVRVASDSAGTAVRQISELLPTSRVHLDPIGVTVSSMATATAASTANGSR